MEIKLKYATLTGEPGGVITSAFFSDPGVTVTATHHDTHHYHVISHRCGYGDDVWRYAWEHEFCHHFVPQFMADVPSVVLSMVAMNMKWDSGDMYLGLQEEALVQTFQRWLRANERPILSGADWDKMKSEAITLLESAR